MTSWERRSAGLPPQGTEAAMRSLLARRRSRWPGSETRTRSVGTLLLGYSLETACAVAPISAMLGASETCDAVDRPEARSIQRETGESFSYRSARIRWVNTHILTGWPSFARGPPNCNLKCAFLLRSPAMGLGLLFGRWLLAGSTSFGFYFWDATTGQSSQWYYQRGRAEHTV